MSYKSEFSSSSGWNAVDTNIRLEGDAGKDFKLWLRAQGVHTIIRYYASSKRSKTITSSEVKALCRDGFNFLPVYQDNARRTSDFGKSKGRDSADNAFEFADYTGQPEGSTILFAVDTDFSPSQIDGYVLPYFEGIHDKMGSTFRIGCYGSGLALSKLMKENLIEVPWISMSRGFRGTKDFFYKEDWAMRQIPPPKKRGKFHYDMNYMKWSPEKIGAWKFDKDGKAVIVGREYKQETNDVDDGHLGPTVAERIKMFFLNL